MSEPLGELLPEITTAPPGPAAQAWVDRLAAVECPAITARRSRRRDAGGTDPIVWERARGSNVIDVDGNRYVDLSSGFAVASIGHAHPAVCEAIRAQSDTLIHGMGDLFPNTAKIELGEALARVTPRGLEASILGANGADGVEAAIKTVLVATGRRRVLAFAGSYHGMTLGALAVSGYRDAFREPFAGWLGASDLRLPYPNRGDCPLHPRDVACDVGCADVLDWYLGSDVAGSDGVAAVIVEPIQGRGGDIVPPPGWLQRVREITRRHDVLLVLDEIYTGFGRTGDWFACEHEGVEPDILVAGKALGGGMPISAAIGTRDVMDAWGASQGEALHTSTFLGHPVGCAAALAAIDVIEREGLVERARELGQTLRAQLEDAIGSNPRVDRITGRGLMLGIHLLDDEGAAWAGGGVRAMHALLERGFICCPAGSDGDVLSLSPPFVIHERQLDAAVDAIAGWIASLR